MFLQLGRTAELVNTQFAPVAALIGYYQAQNVLEPLQSVTAKAENRLDQVVLSILTGCEYIAEVNTKLRSERKLAQVKRIDCFAEQSTLSPGLAGLSQMNLAQLEAVVHQISRRCSRSARHDWRGFLKLDFDLSALPCGKQAEGSRKGHFSDKKTSPDANWPVSAPSNTNKRCGQDSTQATMLRCNVCNRPSWTWKVHLT